MKSSLIGGSSQVWAGPLIDPSSLVVVMIFDHFLLFLILGTKFYHSNHSWIYLAFALNLKRSKVWHTTNSYGSNMMVNSTCSSLALGSQLFPTIQNKGWCLQRRVGTIYTCRKEIGFPALGHLLTPSKIRPPSQSQNLVVNQTAGPPSLAHGITVSI